MGYIAIQNTYFKLVANVYYTVCLKILGQSFQKIKMKLIFSRKPNRISVKFFSYTASKCNTLRFVFSSQLLTNHILIKIQPTPRSGIPRRKFVSPKQLKNNSYNYIKQIKLSFNFGNTILEDLVFLGEMNFAENLLCNVSARANEFWLSWLPFSQI